MIMIRWKKLLFTSNFISQSEIFLKHISIWFLRYYSLLLHHRLMDKNGGQTEVLKTSKPRLIFRWTFYEVSSSWKSQINKNENFKLKLRLRPQSLNIRKKHIVDSFLVRWSRRDYNLFPRTIIENLKNLPIHRFIFCAENSWQWDSSTHDSRVTFKKFT